jgi:hypothetical protein
MSIPGKVIISGGMLKKAAILALHIKPHSFNRPNETAG